MERKNKRRKKFKEIIKIHIPELKEDERIQMERIRHQIRDTKNSDTVFGKFKHIKEKENTLRASSVRVKTGTRFLKSNTRSKHLGIFQIPFCY